MSTDLRSDPLPLHRLDANKEAIQLKEIAHKNPYDFTQKHRHSYFEIMFFEKGGGTQLIDFHEYTVKDNSCYIVYPKQIHLLKRTSDSNGALIQFKEASFSDPVLTKRLNDRLWRGHGGVLFEENDELMWECHSYLDIFRTQERSGKRYRAEAERHLLQSMLYDLLSLAENEPTHRSTDTDLYLFMKLIDAHHQNEHSVQFYLGHLSVSEKKLGNLTKEYLGLSPLQVIHGRLVIEAKRRLVFGDVSQKQIALDLGFVSPARFSAFIKTKTGMTPSELKSQLAGIHK